MCTGGRAGLRYVITKFSRMDSLPNFVTHGGPLRARESSANIKDLFCLFMNHLTSLSWELARLVIYQPREFLSVRANYGQ